MSNLFSLPASVCHTIVIAAFIVFLAVSLPDSHACESNDDCPDGCFCAYVYDNLPVDPDNPVRYEMRWNDECKVDDKENCMSPGTLCAVWGRLNPNRPCFASDSSQADGHIYDTQEDKVVAEMADIEERRCIVIGTAQLTWDKKHGFCFDNPMSGECECLVESDWTPQDPSETIQNCTWCD